MATNEKSVTNETRGEVEGTIAENWRRRARWETTGIPVRRLPAGDEAAEGPSSFGGPRLRGCGSRLIAIGYQPVNDKVILPAGCCLYCSAMLTRDMMGNRCARRSPVKAALPRGAHGQDEAALPTVSVV